MRMLNPATYSDGVWALLEGFQEYFGYGMGANVYLTPSATQGFSPHYGAFVLLLVDPVSCAPSALQMILKHLFSNLRAVNDGAYIRLLMRLQLCLDFPLVRLLPKLFMTIYS